MPDFTTLVVFAGAALALLLVPGPSVLYIVTRGIDQGRAAGIVSAMGVGLGNMVHVMAAALGLSAVLMSSALAFQAIKLLGAAYLIYLGVRTLMAKEHATAGRTVTPRSIRRVFSQGVVVAALNPKTALFFLAFLPQFVDPATGPVAGQLLVLGLIFAGMGIVSDSMYALLSGVIGGWLRSSTRFLRSQRYFTGGVYLTLGVATALTGSHRK